MLLTTITVFVPADREVEADQNEFGGLSNKSRAAFGEAAVTAGNPEHDTNDPDANAADAIANILHWLDDYSSWPEKAVESALLAFRGER